MGDEGMSDDPSLAGKKRFSERSASDSEGIGHLQPLLVRTPSKRVRKKEIGTGRGKGSEKRMVV